MRADALICFSKTGPMKYIGHLDLLKLFQRAVRRCGLPVNFSEGFNPHLRVTFALPLPLGMEGMREYAVFEMGEDVPADAIGERLRAVLPAEIGIEGARYMSPGEKSPAAAVCAADYALRFCNAGVEEAARYILDNEVIEAEKSAKSGKKTVDIKPDIYGMEVLGNTVTMRIAAGSARSLKPEHAARAIAPGEEYTCRRLELLKRAGEGFISLFENPQLS